MNKYLESLLNLCLSAIEKEECLRKIQGKKLLTKQECAEYSLKLSQALVRNEEFKTFYLQNNKDKFATILEEELKNLYLKAD